MSRSSRKMSSFSLDALAKAETRLLPPGSKSGLPVALGYPNDYSVGMSNLGFHQVYRLLHEQSDVQVERFFRRSESDGTLTLEESRPLGAFRVVAFSLPYEADYTSVVACLRKAGIPVRREKRGWHDPFILLGGIALTANPRPLSPLADLIVLGECELAFPRLLSELVPAIYQEKNREAVLGRIVGLPGVYVPRLSVDAVIQRLTKSELEMCPAHSVFLTPHTVFQDTFLVEIGRGCQRGCLFCLTGNLLPRCRTRSADSVLQQVESWGQRAEKVGLISPEVSSHPKIEEIVESLISKGKRVTVSSMETDRVTPRLLELLGKGGMQSLTLAPECGNDRFRRRLGKPYTNDQILTTVSEAAQARIRKIKLYYLVGAPDSLPDEVDAIIRLTHEAVKAFRSSNTRAVAGEIGVAVSPFVPKPYTPLAASPMMPAPELRRRLSRARRGLSQLPGVKVSVGSVREAVTEHRISTGDESVFEELLGNRR